MTEPSMCGSDAALCQITLTTCYVYYAIRQHKQHYKHDKYITRNSLGDGIANVNFFYDDIVHVEASAYAH